MGLDVSLYKVDDLEKMLEKEKDYEKKSEKIWEKERAGRNYDLLTEKEKDEIHSKCVKLAEKMGLTKDGEYKNKKRIEKNSRVHPDHMFKIGYMRSSYNDGGINSVLREIIGMDLYTIFTPNDDYYQKIDWKKALEKAKEVYDAFSKHLEQAPFRCMPTTSFFSSTSVTSEKEALEVATEEFKRFNSENGPKYNYSNKSGDFYFKSPLEICGIIKGTSERTFNKETKECAYLIYKSDMAWYKEALEVVIEQIKYVLKQDDPSQFVLGWSA